MEEVGANPGRSAHTAAVEAGRIVLETRETLATLFGIGDSSRIVFTSNATEGINLALFGFLREGDRVVTTGLEHNAVMRPLRYLTEVRHLRLEICPCSPRGELDMDRLDAILRAGARLFVVNHASNVIGTIQPLEEIGAMTEGYGVPLLVDAAQSAGSVPIDVSRAKIALLAFTGHKALFGPQGTGGLYIRDDIELRPLKLGGTGSLSEREEQPDFLPDRYECGTPNTPGIAGLGAGVRFVLGETLDAIRRHEVLLARRLLEGLASIDRIRVYCPGAPSRMLPTVSINVPGMSPAEVGYRLDREHEIAVRVGLHCAPATHRTVGTFPRGTVRLSPGYLNTEAEVDAVCAALREIVETGIGLQAETPESGYDR
jgi:cysteine desulfurase family protein